MEAYTIYERKYKLKPQSESYFPVIILYSSSGGGPKVAVFPTDSFDFLTEGAGNFNLAPKVLENGDFQPHILQGRIERRKGVSGFNPPRPRKKMLGFFFTADSRVLGQQGKVTSFTEAGRRPLFPALINKLQTQ